MTSNHPSDHRPKWDTYQYCEIHPDEPLWMTMIHECKVCGFYEKVHKDGSEENEED